MGVIYRSGTKTAELDEAVVTHSDAESKKIRQEGLIAMKGMISKIRSDQETKRLERQQVEENVLKTKEYFKKAFIADESNKNRIRENVLDNLKREIAHERAKAENAKTNSTYAVLAKLAPSLGQIIGNVDQIVENVAEDKVKTTFAALDANGIGRENVLKVLQLQRGLDREAFADILKIKTEAEGGSQIGALYDLYKLTGRSKSIALRHLGQNIGANLQSRVNSIGHTLKVGNSSVKEIIRQGPNADPTGEQLSAARAVLSEYAFNNLAGGDKRVYEPIEDALNNYFAELHRKRDAHRETKVKLDLGKEQLTQLKTKWNGSGKPTGGVKNFDWLGSFTGIAKEGWAKDKKITQGKILKDEIIWPVINAAETGDQVALEMSEELLKTTIKVNGKDVLITEHFDTLQPIIEKSIRKGYEVVDQAADEQKKIIDTRKKVDGNIVANALRDPNTNLDALQKKYPQHATQINAVRTANKTGTMDTKFKAEFNRRAQAMDGSLTPEWVSTYDGISDEVRKKYLTEANKIFEGQPEYDTASSDIAIKLKEITSYDYSTKKEAATLKAMEARAFERWKAAYWQAYNDVSLKDSYQNKEGAKIAANKAFAKDVDEGYYEVYGVGEKNAGEWKHANVFAKNVPAHADSARGGIELDPEYLKKNAYTKPSDVVNFTNNGIVSEEVADLAVRSGKTVHQIYNEQDELFRSQGLIGGAKPPAVHDENHEIEKAYEYKPSHPELDCRFSACKTVPRETTESWYLEYTLGPDYWDNPESWVQIPTMSLEPNYWLKREENLK